VFPALPDSPAPSRLQWRLNDVFTDFPIVGKLISLESTAATRDIANPGPLERHDTGEFSI